MEGALGQLWKRPQKWPSHPAGCTDYCSPAFSADSAEAPWRRRVDLVAERCVGNVVHQLLDGLALGTGLTLDVIEGSLGPSGQVASGDLPLEVGGDGLADLIDLGRALKLGNQT